MTLSELQAMTVIQLRRFARENSIVLGAGIDKAGMVGKIAAVFGLGPSQQQQSFLDLAADDSAPSRNDSADAASAEPNISAGSDAEITDGLTEAKQDQASSSSPKVIEKSVALSTEDKKANARPLQRSVPVSERKDLSPRQASDEGQKPTDSTEKTGVQEPRFQAAWHSPDSPQAPGHGWQAPNSVRPSWQGTSGTGRSLTGEPRVNPLRSHSFGPRFGPAGTSSPGPTVSSTTSSPAAPAIPALESQLTAPVSESQPADSNEKRPVFSDHRSGFGPQAAKAPDLSGETSSDRALTEADQPSGTDDEAPVFEDPNETPTLEELLSSGEFEEGSGILELHPDGYGFLRSKHFLPSSRDIYVSMAQIRRFSLRTGDLIQGKIRPQREGDKYAALLYIDSVNGMPEDECVDRPIFDELTAVYPTKKISLESHEGPAIPSLRLIDLIAPLGFGQRALLLCPPDTGKRELLADYARIISENYPDVEVLMLLIDMTPEDVTAFRDRVPVPVLASTFDQAPESHLRLTEMVVERAMRLVEQKKDVVILADSLTRLAKIYTTAAIQQGRSVPGMVNPASLLRAKRLFGAARAMKEGGSLTVIATMDIQTGNRVDDSIVEEFKGTANMELMLDQNVAAAGVVPSLNLQRSFTKNSDILLDDQQKEGLYLMRQMLGSVSSAVAIPQLLSMMEKAPTNSELLKKMKDWYALMSMTNP